MSEPGDELHPIEEQPPEKAPLSRSPYVALGVAAVVVATTFATVAALASRGGEDDNQSQPSPVNRETVEVTSVDEDGTTRVTTTVVTTTTTTPAETTTTTTKKKTTTTTVEQPVTTTTTTTKPPDPLPPTAAFGFNCPDGTLQCSFDAGDSADPEGGSLVYTWSFGDGGGGNGGVTISHNYAKAGTYTVKLVVTDQQGLTATTSKQVTVTETTPPGGTTTN